MELCGGQDHLGRGRLTLAKVIKPRPRDIAEDHAAEKSEESLLHPRFHVPGLSGARVSTRADQAPERPGDPGISPDGLHPGPHLLGTSPEAAPNLLCRLCGRRGVQAPE